MNALVLTTTMATLLISTLSGAAHEDEFTALLPAKTCSHEAESSEALNIRLPKIYAKHTAQHLDISVGYYKQLQGAHTSAQRILSDINKLYPDVEGTIYPVKMARMEEQKNNLRALIGVARDLLKKYNETIGSKKYELSQLNPKIDFSCWNIDQLPTITERVEDRGSSCGVLGTQTQVLIRYFNTTKDTHLTNMIKCLNDYLAELTQIKKAYEDLNDSHQHARIRRINQNINQALHDRGAFEQLKNAFEE